MEEKNQNNQNGSFFSIIIPAYNEEKYIIPCLESVLALNKNFNCEIIVVNNASTDNTQRIIRENFPLIKIVDEPKKGLTIAYNRGAGEAKGDILVFVDADVVLPRNHLEKVIKEFDKDPQISALSGPYFFRDGGFFSNLVFLSAALFVAMPMEFIGNRFLNLGAGMTSGNCIIKKEAFDKAGGFNEEIFYGLDADLALKIRKFGKVRYKFSLLVNSSARRLKKEGTLRILIRYIMNVVWPNFFGRPFTKDYIDVR